MDFRQMAKTAALALAASFVLSAAGAAGRPPASEIAVRIRFDQLVFVSGERIRAVVDVANSSLDSIDVGSRGSEDSLFVELYRASDHQAYDRIGGRPFVAPFTLHSSEGQKLETVLSDHFAMTDATRYLARAVLVHRSVRYESSFRSFDVVPGMHVGGALQIFAGHEGLTRTFELVHWGRERMEHLFLKAEDSTGRRWRTFDLGPYMSVTAPKISIADSGEITVLHRSSQDRFTRTVFWSLVGDLEFQGHSALTDPNVAGSERVKEVYRAHGETPSPAKRSWWRFW